MVDTCFFSSSLSFVSFSRKVFLLVVCCNVINLGVCVGMLLIVWRQKGGGKWMTWRASVCAPEWQGCDAVSKTKGKEKE